MWPKFGKHTPTSSISPSAGINEAEIVNASPVPSKMKLDNFNIPGIMTFSEALSEVMKGHKITKAEWGDTHIYGLLNDGKLMLHIDDTFKDWIISDGDMTGEDWIVLVDTN